MTPTPRSTPQQLLTSASAQQQANRASLLRREQSARTIAKGVRNATIAVNAAIASNTPTA